MTMSGSTQLRMKVAIGLGGVLARYVTCAAPSSLMRSGSPSGGGRVANRIVACPGVWPSGFFITPSMGVPRVTSVIWPFESFALNSLYGISAARGRSGATTACSNQTPISAAAAYGSQLGIWLLRDG
jgi:hypothetical protein